MYFLVLIPALVLVNVLISVVLILKFDHFAVLYAIKINVRVLVHITIYLVVPLIYFTHFAIIFLVLFPKFVTVLIPIIAHFIVNMPFLKT